jgi:hypothetical protein
MSKRRLVLGGATAVYLAIAGASCFESGTRWLPPLPAEPVEPVCALGDLRCTSALEECVEVGGAADWVVIDDCAAKGKLCAPGLFACVSCLPNAPYCDGQEARLCGTDGESSELLAICDPSKGEACRSGGCPHLCDLAAQEKSNVGCEYWPVDLDNAMLDPTRNAAAQQYAVVVSNPQPDVPVEVVIHRDDGDPGGEADIVEIARAVIAPLNLRVFKLGPREVDGSPLGEFDTGTHSALTRAAFRVTSDFPVVAYQFNPLENVNVFSNDASLLKPTEAFTYDNTDVVLAYVVAGWPQTIAHTDNPNTNFSSANPINLRSFLTIVGTRANTTVRVRPTTTVIAGDGIPGSTPGGLIELTLGPFDVANLETPNMNAFGADFTGTLVEADQPVAVFVGSEASDAPSFETLSERRCCADHLEEQLDPVRAAGKKFAIAHSPSRTATVTEAGAKIGVAPEPEYVRFVATRPTATVIHTTLPPPHDLIQLFKVGDFAEVTTYGDFLAESSEPIHVVQVMASQDAANVPRELPGGDPSLLVLPPREQFRSDYVFLTPDKYAFDFVTIVASPQAAVFLDGIALDSGICEVGATDGLSDEEREGPPELVTYRCQLSFGLVDPNTGAVSEGIQNDGVHRVTASEPVGVVVFGFDAFVSYAYAAGTELREIAPPL